MRHSFSNACTSLTLALLHFLTATVLQKKELGRRWRLGVRVAPAAPLTQPHGAVAADAYGPAQKSRHKGYCFKNGCFNSV